MRLLTVFISLILVTAVNADEPKSFNPADVTEAASHIPLSTPLFLVFCYFYLLYLRKDNQFCSKLEFL